MNKLLRFDTESTFVLWDMETLNLSLSFAHNLPWQLGMLKVQNNQIIDSKDFLIKWDTDLKISNEAAIITRYSQIKVDEQGLPPEKVFPVMHDWLDKADWLIGHNLLNFDVYLLKEWCLLNNKPWKQFLYKIIDTNAIAKGIGLGLTYRPEDDFLEYQYKMLSVVKKGLKTNLTALGKQYEIEHDFESLHSSLSDIQLNLKVWNKLKYQIDI